MFENIDYNKIKEGEYGELKRLLYFLVNNDKEVLDSLYGEDKLMEDIKKKIEQVTNDLDYLFYYDMEELERKTQERMKREGFAEGREEGRVEGHKEACRAIALNLLKSSIPDKVILESTNITKKELDKLKKLI